MVRWLWIVVLYLLLTQPGYAQQRGASLDPGYTSLDLSMPLSRRERSLVAWYITLPGVNAVGSGDSKIPVRDLTGRLSGAYGGMATAPTASSGPGRTDRPGGWGQWNFDGTNDYLNAGTSPINLAKPFSITAWIKIADITSNAYVIVGLSYTDVIHSYGLFMHRADKSGLTYQYTDTGATAKFPNIASQNLVALTWTHVALVANPPASTLTIYQNAVVVSHTTGFTQAAFNETGQGYGIGVWGTNSPVSNFFKGAIDDVKMYAQALAVQEIQQEYVESQQRYPRKLQRQRLQWTHRGIGPQVLRSFAPWFQ